MILRTCGRLSPTVAFSLFSDRPNYDTDLINKPTNKVAETGFDRVKMIYTADEFGEASLELHHIVQSSLTGAFIGACYGGFIDSRLAYLYFIENNQATIFKTTMEAKKKLQNFVTVAFARGAVRWGWRLGFFTGLFSLTSTTLSAYTGQTSLTEYVTAGAITGALYKANLGLAASFVGAGLGAALSALGGGLILIILKLSGASMDDIRKALHKIYEARTDQMNQALEKSADIKNDDLTRHHDLLVETHGEKKVGDL